MVGQRENYPEREGQRQVREGMPETSMGLRQTRKPESRRERWEWRILL
jgi:hypothetical protein